MTNSPEKLTPRTSLLPGRRVLVAQFGETPLDAIANQMELGPMDAPDIGTLGRADVVIAIKSVAVGWVDLLMTSGQYQHMPKPPYCPGMEYAGVVAWTGDEVDELSGTGSGRGSGRGRGRVRVGDRVLVDGFLAGPRSLGAYQAYGGFASYAVAPADAVHAIPGQLTFDEACNLLGNYETAYHCLVTRGRLRQGETVLIHGASGATGLAAVEVAKLVGANVIATGRSDAKLETVRARGADNVINCRAVDDGSGGTVRPFRDEVKALTGGRGVDVVYDGVGGEITAESLKCVAFGARLLIVGWASTPFVARGKGGRGAPNANVLPTNLIMMKGVDVLGCPTAIATANDPSLRQPRLTQILEWAAEGKIHPHVSHRYPLDAFRDAMRAKWNGDVTGGCVLHP